MTDTLIAGRTLENWQELSRRDDCFERLVPSDIRCLLATIQSLQAERDNAVGQAASLSGESEQWEHMAQQLAADLCPTDPQSVIESARDSFRKTPATLYPAKGEGA